MNSGSSAYLLIASLVLTFFTSTTVHAQKMPKADVVDVPAIAEGLCVSNVFQTNMVIQRDKPIRIWGWADAAEQVNVSFAGNKASIKANKDRTWQVELPAVPANDKPQELTIQGKSKTLTLKNILVGDVWVLGGQSNMEFELAKVENGNLEIVTANYPDLRILTVPQGVGPETQHSFARLHEWSDWSSQHFRKGDWDICTPKIAAELSAIGYVFARRVHMGSKIPIGVIDASRGGTTVETWTPLPVLRQLKSKTTQAKLAKVDKEVADWNPQSDLEKRILQHKQFVEKMTKEGKPIPDDRKLPPSDLKPGPLKDMNYPGNSYAGMLSTLAGLSVKGAIFHQGFNNAFDGSNGAEMYRDVFPEMIKAWRENFKDPAMPFGIISLCTEGNPQTRDDYCEKMFNAGIEIREAHYLTFLKLYQAGDKNIGFADSYDLRRRWFHPQVKLPAGERIARWALATQYGFNRELEWLPPQLLGMEAKEKSLLLKFNVEVGDPEEGQIEGFAIAGVDGKFHPADVEYAEKSKDARGTVQYDKKQLVLTSIMVSKPIHYRYAWGRNPLANLQMTGNKDIPFPTQRSDTWRMEEAPVGIVKVDSEQGPTRADDGKILNALREQDKLRRLKEAEQLIKSKGDLKAKVED